MSRLTQFYSTPKPPNPPRDRWMLGEADDGSLHVFHQWNHPEIASTPYSGRGHSRLSLQGYFRSEACDTAKHRLRVLLSEMGRENS